MMLSFHLPTPVGLSALRMQQAGTGRQNTEEPFINQYLPNEEGPFRTPLRAGGLCCGVVH